MKNFYFALGIVFTLIPGYALGAEAGMPQLNPEFWISQIFWLTLIFSSLYIIIWKVFLPRVTDTIENRKLKLVNDLNETEKLKKNAERKLNEYNEIIEDAKNEAKKIIQENKKKLDIDIKNKKQKFNKEIEEELMNVEKEIKNFKKNSIPGIKKIAVEISHEVIKQTMGTEMNLSSISATVDDISKEKVIKYL